MYKLVLALLLIVGVNSHINFCSDKNCQESFKSIHTGNCYTQHGYIIYQGEEYNFNFLNESTFNELPAVFLSDSATCRGYNMVMYFERGSACYTIGIPIIMNSTLINSIRYYDPTYVAKTQFKIAAK